MAKGGFCLNYTFEERHAGPAYCVDHFDFGHAADVAVPLEVGSPLHFLEADPLGLVHLEAALDELSQLKTDLLLELLIPDVFANVGLELLVVLAIQQRLLAVQHLEDKHPEGPDIGLRTIQVLHVALRRHVERRADAKIVEGLTASQQTYLLMMANPKSAILTV